MNRKLVKAIGFVGALGVAVGGPTLAAWAPLKASAAPSDADAIAMNQTMPHVGEWTNAQGTVSEVFTTRGIATVVDVGGHYPDLTFKAVLFPDGASSKLGPSERRIVIVSGTIKLIRGQPELFVTSRDQVAL